MPLTYVSDGAWGTGQGAPLNANQHDTNIFTLAEGIAALETAFDEGVTLVDPYVTSAGSIITFHLSNDDTVSVAVEFPTFTYRGTWLPSTAYAIGDIITVAGTGSFIVNVPHVSDTTFDPEAVEEGTDGDLLYGLLLPDPDLTNTVKWLGVFPAETTINQNDVFSDPTYGVFIANSTHVSDTTFDPEAVDDESNPLYTRIAAPPYAPVLEIDDTTYSITRADAGLYLRFTNVAGCTITFDTDTTGFEINTEIHMEQCEVGSLIFEAGSGVQLLPQRDGFDTESPFQGAVTTAKCVSVTGDDIWKLIGPHSTNTA